MPKQFIKGLGLVFIGVFAAGCATGGGGVSARSYVVDKPRVDQNMQGGNQGYLMGTPKEVDRSQYSKTRRVYVLEVTKEDPEPGDTGVVVEDVQPAQPVSRASSYHSDLPPEEPRRVEPPARRQAIVIPPIDDDEEYVAEPSSRRSAEMPMAEDYTIQKNDTLQKISKKFYGSYAKWQKIYDANTDVLKDPNHIKPGVTIRIPAE